MSLSRQVLTHEDVTAVVGPVEDATAAAILALRPSQEELIEAFAWATGESEPLAAAGRSQEGKVAALVDILLADQDVDEP